MKYLYLLILIIISSTVFAADKFKLQGIEKSHYSLSIDDDFKVESSDDVWNFVFENNEYFLVTRSYNVPLVTLKTDENIISLSQSVVFSGTRVFTFYRKSKKFVRQETAYSSFPELQINAGHRPELISIYYGDYIIE